MYALIGLFVTAIVIAAWLHTWKRHIMPAMDDEGDPFGRAMGMVVLIVGMLLGVVMAMTLWPYLIVGFCCLLIVRHYARAGRPVR